MAQRLKKVMTKISGDETREAQLLNAEEVQLMNAYWRAANYLSVGQIYLLDNVLLREPLKLEHTMPRPLRYLGWATAAIMMLAALAMFLTM